MSREYPKKANESTWNGAGAYTGTTGKERESYKKGFHSSNGETEMQKRPAPLGAPAVENQPRQYTKSANPLMPTPTKQSLVPHFAKGGRVQGGGGGGNPNKATPAGGQMPGGMPTGGALGGMPTGGALGGDMGSPMTSGLGGGVGPGAQTPGGAGGGMSSGALGGMAPPVGGALPPGAGGAQMPGKPPGYGGGAPDAGAPMTGNAAGVARVTKDRPDKGGQKGGDGRRPAVNPMHQPRMEGGGGDYPSPEFGGPSPSADQSLSSPMQSGFMGPPDVGNGMGISFNDPGMRGDSFTTGGGFGSDASGGYSSFGGPPDTGVSTNPGGGWGGESHFARGGKAVPPRGQRPTLRSGASSPGQNAPGPNFMEGFGPDGKPVDVTSPMPGDPFSSLGGSIDPRFFDAWGNDQTTGVGRPPSQPQPQPYMGAPSGTITRAPGAGSVYSAGGGSMGGGDMGQPNYGGFNGGGYGSFDYGTNPNHTGRTFDDNYGGANPNDTGGGGNSGGGGYGGSGGSSGGGFGGADQESKG